MLIGGPLVEEFMKNDIYKKRILVLTNLMAMLLLASSSATRAEMVFDESESSVRVAELPVESESVDMDAEDSAEAAPVATAKKKKLSKSETMRRHRVRTEIKNEDLLTNKLEELRLQDELKRTDAILKSENISKAVQDSNNTSVISGSTLVAPPATVMAMPAAANPQGENLADLVKAENAKLEAKIESIGEEKASKETSIHITPKGGLSNLFSRTYDIESRYSLGVDLTFDVSRYFAMTAGYAYSTYALGAGSSLNYGSGFVMSSLQRLNLKDNVINVGARVYLTDKDARARPFFGLGVAYRRGYLNYDERTRDSLRQFNPNAAPDITLSGFSGYAEGGVEINITKNIGIMAGARYFHTLSSTQSSPVEPGAFFSPYAGNMGYYGMTNMNQNINNVYASQARNNAGKALAQNHFVQIFGGVTISF